MGGASFHSGIPSNPNSSSALTPHLNSTGFKDVISALNIDPQSIVKVVKQNGVADSIALSNQMQELQVVHINHDLENVVRTLGLHIQDVVIILNTDDDIESIRKRFKKLKDAQVDPKQLNKLLTAMGISIPEDRMVVQDELGGLYIIKNALDELKDSDASE